MSRLVIGITVSQKDIQWGRNNFIPSEYTKAIQAAGGTPQYIPLEFPLDQIEELQAECAGILLTGGEDIEPGRYNKLSHVMVQHVCVQRDELEFRLARLAAEREWPILGICRGHQMLNVALRGTLYTHIPAQFTTNLDHEASEYNDHHFLSHSLDIVEKTRLSEIIGSNHLEVNSRHHQAVRDLAPGLQVTARASDGLIEGLELPGHPYFIGVQWHPECLQDIAEQRNIFYSFVSAAERSAAGG